MRKKLLPKKGFRQENDRNTKCKGLPENDKITEQKRFYKILQTELKRTCITK